MTRCLPIPFATIPCVLGYAALTLHVFWLGGWWGVEIGFRNLAHAVAGLKSRIPESGSCRVLPYVWPSRYADLDYESIADMSAVLANTSVDVFVVETPWAGSEGETVQNSLMVQ